MRPEDRLIVALDCDYERAKRLVAELLGTVNFFKIGHQLAYAGGLDLARSLVSLHHRVFMDLKLHDIPNTVTEGAKAVAGMGVDFLTVHAYPKTMEAALRGVEGTKTQVLGVSVLTSDSTSDLHEAGYSSMSPRMLVGKRALQAAKLGVPGLVCSAHEAHYARLQYGDRPCTIVTPGIRFKTSETHDQVRVATPKFALAEGADYLVVGRMVTDAPLPYRAIQEVVQEVTHATA